MHIQITILCNSSVFYTIFSHFLCILRPNLGFLLTAYVRAIYFIICLTILYINIIEKVLSC